MTRIRILSLVVCGLAATLASAPTHAADRALLVGLDDYLDARVSHTPGGTDDARSTAAVLQERFGFPGDGIRILLNEEATSTRIVEEFSSWLVDGTTPGDRVFFLYAGHGSQLRDVDGDEDDGWDETLAPYDVDPETGEGQIRDDTLDLLIAQLSGRRAVLLFDACHSGTVTRGLAGLRPFPQGGGARYLPRADQFRAIWGSDGRFRTRSGNAQYGLLPDSSPGEKSVVDDPSKLGRLTGIVAISASHPGQLAYPLEVDGRYRGALTYLFQQLHTESDLSRSLLGSLAKKTVATTGSSIKKSATGAVTSGIDAAAAATDLQQGLTVGALEMAINHGMKQLQQDGRLQGDQEPWFEVISEYPIEKEPLFGEWEQASAVAMSNPVAPARVELKTADGRSRFEEGEEIEFEVSTDRPGYLYLLVFSEQRAATCIFPNRDDRANRIEAGSRKLPRRGDYRFPVARPFGRDLVVAVVADEPLDLCERVDYSWDEIFERVDLQSAHAELQRRSRRGIRVQSGAPAEDEVEVGSSGLGWQAASLPLETRSAGKGSSQP